MKLLKALLFTSCVFHATARPHTRELLDWDHSDLCIRGECTVDSSNPNVLLFRRKGGKVQEGDQAGTGGTSSKDEASESGISTSGGDGLVGSGTSLSGGSSSSKLDQEEQLKLEFSRLDLPKDKSPRQFDEVDDKVLRVLEKKRDEPDDMFETTPDYDPATLSSRGQRALAPNQQPRSKADQAEIDRRVVQNYEIQQVKPNPNTKDWVEHDKKYVELFTSRGTPADKVHRLQVFSKGAKTREWDDSTAIYYVDEDMRLMVCAEAFAARDTNAWAKGSGDKVVKAENANKDAVTHSDLMWAILSKLGGAQTSTKVKNLKSIVQHDVINLGTVLTLFRNSKADNRAASDARTFTLADRQEWAGVANVNPSMHLKRNHPEVAGDRQPTEVRTMFMRKPTDAENSDQPDLILALVFS